ncbi:MAG: sigma-70 family RNA polymerase sigma factor [Chitinophagia bacterium]|nr:sigma-70 family RNA polymerase sigma factor [Chitinophagia bacterium]
MEGSYINEQKTLEALARGDRQATARVYQQNYPIVHKWLLKNGCESDDADDLFQESMVVLFGKVQEADFRLSCSISTYIFSVAKHLWYKKFRKDQAGPVRLQERDGDDDGYEIAAVDDVNVHHEREAHFSQLAAALDQIGEPCRSLLQAFYHKDRSMQQIAAEFGYTNPENAKTQKYKCLTRLRKLFHSLQVK